MSVQALPFVAGLEASQALCFRSSQQRCRTGEVYIGAAVGEGGTVTDRRGTGDGGAPNGLCQGALPASWRLLRASVYVCPDVSRSLQVQLHRGLVKSINALDPSMKIVAYILFAIGLGLGLTAFSIDTTVESGGQTIGSGEYSVTVPKSRVNNLGLMEDRRLMSYASGLSLLLGTLLFGFGSINGANRLTEGTNTPVASDDQDMPLVARFRHGAVLASEQVHELIQIATLYPNVTQVVARTNGNSLLHLAALLGDHEGVKKLLLAGASRTQRNGNGQTAYQLAQDALISALLIPELG